MWTEDDSLTMIEQYRQGALMKHKELQNKRMQIKEIREQTFLDSLKEISQQFESQLLQRCMKELEICSQNGQLSRRFYVDHFKNKKGCVRISTLVKGFHNKTAGTWDTSLFRQIGYESTPFQSVVQRLKSNHIILEDISDIQKGLSFWCKISIASS